MTGWSFQVNRGMLVAAVLLVAGGALMLLAPQESEMLRTTGLGIVVLSGVVYLVARVHMMLKERRR